MKVLLVGSGAREHALGLALAMDQGTEVFSYMQMKNPGIARISRDFEIGGIEDFEKLGNFVERNKIDFAVIGPEAPLEKGVVDFLKVMGIPSVGPTKSLARLETSKSFTRELMEKYKIPGNAKFKVFRSLGGVKEFLEEMGEYVVKPDGLTGGKGVKVSGEHLKTIEEGVKYCEEVLKSHPIVVVEERLEGEEFSLQCLCDGRHILATPPAQDHKRAFVGDQGPNTGGMGSYSCENHLLPFLTVGDVEKAKDIVQKTCDAIREETGEEYKGVMYGGFILTKDGVKLLEYNSRFGDPEAMNVLPIIKGSFTDVCRAVIEGRLNHIEINFERKATVCKYAVPEGYPSNPVKGEGIDLSDVGESAKIFYASVEERDGGIYMSGSRAVGFVGIADNIEEAERIAEEGVKSVSGKVFHREDIGTRALLDKRVEHMKNLVGKEKIKLGVLGSTKGSDMQAIIDEIESGKLDAEISAVISNKEDAYILERARKHNLNAVFLDPKGKTREDYDKEMMDILDKEGIELVLLIGYMKIVSNGFIEKWRDRVMNVHPSLLPAFGGGMDTDVHETILNHGVKVSGCTIHFTTEEVDSGPIILQKAVPVEEGETVESLKAKVQKAEGELFPEAIRLFKEGRLKVEGNKVKIL
jgi:fusion protein PurCD